MNTVQQNSLIEQALQRSRTMSSGSSTCVRKNNLLREDGVKVARALCSFNANHSKFRFPCDVLELQKSIVFWRTSKTAAIPETVPFLQDPARNGQEATTKVPSIAPITFLFRSAISATTLPTRRVLNLV